MSERKVCRWCGNDNPHGVHEVSGLHECKSKEDCDFSRSLRAQFGHPASMKDSYIENRFGIDRMGRNVGLRDAVRRTILSSHGGTDDQD